MRKTLATLLAISAVLAHEGERVEEHSALKVFWDSNIEPNLILITGTFLIIAIIIFFWWTHKHS